MSNIAFEWATLRESVVMALVAIRANKLRSILTLLGIVVGVFSIISVMTAVGVLRNSIEEGLSQLGVNTFQVQKYPNFRVGGRRIRNRRDITYEQALQVHKKASFAEAVGIEIWRGGRVLVWGKEKTNPNVSLAGENLEGIITNDWRVSTGRGLTMADMELSRRVIVLGAAVKEKLFPGYVNPVGQTIRVDGSLYQVIGVFEKKGGALGGDADNLAVVPITTFFQKYGKAGRSLHIMVKALNQEVFEDAIEQVRFILRTARNVNPGEEDDFFYYSNDSVVTQFNEFTLYLRVGVLLVSSIALLAAGVGIMNIMLVSVTERTREIGIRKAVGAQRKAILSQFIIEAIILCQIGGIVGVIFGIIGGNVVGLLLEVPAIVPWDWAAIGIGVCSMVGLVFGVYPAWKAAMLDPIEALRYE